MTPETISPWVSLTLSVIALAGIIYNWFSAGGQKALVEIAAHKVATNAKFEEMEQSLADDIEQVKKDQRVHGDAILQRFALVELQLAKFEEALKHLPDRSQAHELAMAIEKMAGQIGTMDARLSGRIEQLDERLKPVASISDRLQEFLLDQAGRK